MNLTPRPERSKLIPLVLVSYVIAWLGILSVWAGVVWAAVHFIRKYW